MLADLGTKLRFAGFLAGGPALFHETRKFCATGSAQAAAASLWRCVDPWGSRVSRSCDPFEGFDGVIQAVAFGFKFAKGAV
jgi:hypothetical protein